MLDINYCPHCGHGLEQYATPVPAPEPQLDQLELGIALKHVILAGKASTALLQRRMRIGYGKASRLIDEMEERGYVSPQNGGRPRDVLVKESDLTLDSNLPDENDIS